MRTAKRLLRYYEVVFPLTNSDTNALLMDVHISATSIRLRKSQRFFFNNPRKKNDSRTGE